LDRLVDVLVDIERREHDHADLVGPVGEDLASRLDSVHHRHADVHQDDVWFQASGVGDRHGTVGGIAYHLDLGAGVEKGGEPFSDHRLIVYDEHPDHCSVGRLRPRNGRRLDGER